MADVKLFAERIIDSSNGSPKYQMINQSNKRNSSFPTENISNYELDCEIQATTDDKAKYTSKSDCIPDNVTGFKFTIKPRTRVNLFASITGAAPIEVSELNLSISTLVGNVFDCFGNLIDRLDDGTIKKCIIHNSSQLPIPFSYPLQFNIPETNKQIEMDLLTSNVEIYPTITYSCDNLNSGNTNSAIFKFTDEKMVRYNLDKFGSIETLDLSTNSEDPIQKNLRLLAFSTDSFNQVESKMDTSGTTIPQNVINFLNGMSQGKIYYLGSITPHFSFTITNSNYPKEFSFLKKYVVNMNNTIDENKNKLFFWEGHKDANGITTYNIMSEGITAKVIDKSNTNKASIVHRNDNGNFHSIFWSLLGRFNFHVWDKFETFNPSITTSLPTLPSMMIASDGTEISLAKSGTEPQSLLDFAFVDQYLGIKDANIKLADNDNTLYSVYLHNIALYHNYPSRYQYNDMNNNLLYI